MQDILGVIQDALATQLDAEFAPIPIYFEEIAAIGDGGEPELPDSYIFADIKPAGIDTLGMYRTDISVLVAISLYKKGASNREYRRLGMVLDGMFRPVFRFGGRAITIHSAGFGVVDGVLQYTFTLRFIPDEDAPVDETLQPMGDVVSMIINA